MCVTDPSETAVSLSLPQVPLVSSSLLSCNSVAVSVNKEWICDLPV